MKKLFLLLIILCANEGFAQRKKSTAPTTQPYSVSNIKIGMHVNDFLKHYPDSISAKQIKDLSKTFVYDSLIINDIEVYDAMMTFYKDRLVDVYFKTIDPMMHIGLSAKYGYNDADEYTEIYDHKLVHISYYGKLNPHYGFTRFKYDESGEEGFIMTDKKGKKLALAQGF